mgnify:CR=1 FL=1
MDERTYYRKKVDTPLKVGEYVYSVVPTKQKLGEGKVNWRWKIVVNRISFSTEISAVEPRGRITHRKIKPSLDYFDCNPNHLPLEQFVFDKKKEAEAWLKLVTEGRLEV